ncbi:MAG: DUF2948 family protein [Alphaproteobacteria bacterium]|nr:DUF2948 family protein [Alphaproteobacteria bacterium]
MSGPLKLRALDDEDLGVVSTFLQDAIVPLAEIEFVPGEKRFALVASRFRWENCPETADMPVGSPVATPAARDVSLAEGVAAYERVSCGVAFEGVEVVRRRGLDPRERGRILELLGMRIEAGAVTLEFAGSATLRLEGARITCRMSDLGDPWPAQSRPRHPGGEAL